MNCIHVGIPIPLNVKEKTWICIGLDFNATVFTINIFSSFQLSAISLIHSSAFGWQLQQAPSSIFQSCLCQATLSGSSLEPPSEVREPSTGFWIHPRGFLSIGYTLNSSKRMHSGGTLFKSRILSAGPLHSQHSRCQDPSLTSQLQ